MSHQTQQHLKGTQTQDETRNFSVVGQPPACQSMYGLHPHYYKGNPPTTWGPLAPTRQGPHTTIWRPT